jgi:ubiquinone/menaquinone biosynthesis C-methylase UbiE
MPSLSRVGNQEKQKRFFRDVLTRNGKGATAMISLWNEESATEGARRLLQERFLTWQMEGIFPERTMLTGKQRILEIGCGPGSWSLDVARSYPTCTVVGIDSSAAMIGYAQSLKDLHGLANVHFKRMSSDARLHFAPESFNLMTMHWNIASLCAMDWSQLLQDCVQAVRPGGTLRIVEEDLLGQNNGAALTQLSRFCRQLLHQKSGLLAFDEGGEGSMPTSEAFLHAAGCEQVSHSSSSITVSFGEAGYQVYAQCLHLLFLHLLPLFATVATQEELEQLHGQVLEDLSNETFQGQCDLGIRWGETKRANEAKRGRETKRANEAKRGRETKTGW